MFASHADVDEDPENETWAEFVEGFDVEGTNGGVEFAADEELKSNVRTESGLDSSVIRTS